MILAVSCWLGGPFLFITDCWDLLWFLTHCCVFSLAAGVFYGFSPITRGFCCFLPFHWCLLLHLLLRLIQIHMIMMKRVFRPRFHMMILELSRHIYPEEQEGEHACTERLTAAFEVTRDRNIDVDGDILLYCSIRSHAVILYSPCTCRLLMDDRALWRMLNCMKRMSVIHIHNYVHNKQ